MRKLKNWQDQLRERFLQKTLRRQQHQRRPVPFENARSVGLIFDATEQKSRDIVLPFAEKIKKEGKDVQLIGYFDNKLDTSSFTFKGFNKKDLDFLGRPKKLVLDNYVAQSFDVLICIYEKNCPAIEFIAALSDAHLRIGPYTEKIYCYDLFIDTSKDKSIQHFLKEVDFYLHKINQEA